MQLSWYCSEIIQAEAAQPSTRKSNGRSLKSSSARVSFRHLCPQIAPSGYLEAPMLQWLKLSLCSLKYSLSVAISEVAQRQSQCIQL